MKARNAVLGLSMLVISFGMASGANAVTLEEFYKAPDSIEQATPGNPSKGDIIAAVYKAYSRHYDSKKETSHIADCMDRTYSTKTNNGSSRLNALVSQYILAAKEDKTRQYTIENIVQRIIEAECGTAKSTQQKSGESN